MTLKRLILILFSIFIIISPGISQVGQNTDQKILFRGLILDAGSLVPISNSQIMINRAFSSLSKEDGSFAFIVNKYDTVTFRSLGYKPYVMFISDTLKGKEFITGVYLNTDTLSIGEVIILPGYTNLKSEILNAKSTVPTDMENARYNVAVSAYQGKKSQSVLGNPIDNYNVISQRQKINAFEKGGIPSDHIVGLSPLILLPAAYSLIHGSPESVPPFRSGLTDDELEQIQKRYLETKGK